MMISVQPEDYSQLKISPDQSQALPVGFGQIVRRCSLVIILGAD